MASKAELALILSLVDEVSKTARGIKGELLDVGKTGQGLQGTLKQVGSGLASLGTAAIIGGITATTAAVTGLGAACAKLAIDALPLQGIRDSFRGITDDADATLAALREGSLGMVRDAELMKSYNLAAQLVGKTFADQLPEAMKYTSKVAMATGQDQAYMIDSLVKGVGRLSPMILDNLGIQVQLSDATERAAEMFGVEAEALTKAQIQAGMMDVVLEKLRENTKDMPEVSEAQRLWASLGVTLGNLKDEVGLALIPTLLRLLKPLGELISTHGPALVSLFEAHVIPILETVAGAVGVFIAEVGKGTSPLEALRAALATVIPPETMAQIEDIIARVQGLATTVGTFVSDHAEEFKAALIAIGALLAGAAIASGIMSIAGAIAALANPVTLVIAAVGLLAAAWAGNWGGIRDKTQAVIDWISPYIQQALAAIQGWWAAHGDQVLATISAAWQWVQDAFNAGVAFVQGLIQGGTELWGNIWAQHGETITRVINLAWQNIQAIVEAGRAVVEGIIDMFHLAQDGKWREFGARLREIVDSLWATLQTVFRNAVTGLATIVSDLVRTILTKFREVDWGEVGRNIIEGVANGIKNAAGFLADAARNAARAALEAAKGFLGIHSPSSVAAEMIGRPFVEGIGEGIDRAMRQLTQVQLPGLADQMVQAPVMAPAGGRIDYNRLGEAVAAAIAQRPTYQIQANYRYQDERDLRDDIRLMQMLGAAT